MINNRILFQVAILSQSRETHKQAKALAKRLGVVLNPTSLEKYQFALAFEHGKLNLIELKTKPWKSVSVDLSIKNLKRVSLQNTLLAKAVGIKPHQKPSVLDACAGLGVDALTLLLLGCQVTLLERSPIIFELLRDGFERALGEGIGISVGYGDILFKGWAFGRHVDWILEKPTLFQIDALAYLDQLLILRTHSLARLDSCLSKIAYPDVIYLDPMYPERQKQALAKKEMQILQQLIGEDLDSEDLLKKALACASKRVVVKRRRLDPWLGNLKPHVAFSGKAVRFDVYFL